MKKGNYAAYVNGTLMAKMIPLQTLWKLFSLKFKPFFLIVTDFDWEIHIS